MKYYNYYDNIIYFKNDLIYWHTLHLGITNIFFTTSFDEHTNILNSFFDSKKEDLSHLKYVFITIDYNGLIKLILSKKREIKLNILI